MKVYKIIKKIPLTEFQIDNFIVLNNGKYYYNNDLEVPFFNEEMINKYCVPVEIKPLKYKVGDYAFMKFGDKLMECQIIDTIPLFMAYKVRLSKAQSNHETYINECFLFQTEIYYYYTTTGTIAFAFIGKNKKADFFRKKTNNFFKTKQECQEYISNIFLNFKE